MRFLSRSLRLALVGGLAVAGTACLSSSDTVTGNNNTSYSLVRLVQAMSDTSVTFSFGSGQASGALAFGTYVPASGTICSSYTNYCQITATPPLIATATGTSAPFYNQTASSIAANGAFTVIALGHVASGATPAATVAIIADTTGVSSSTNALVRVFNALDYVKSSATGTLVDVYIYPEGGTRPASPADTSLRALAWNTRSAYVSRVPADLVVDVFAAGAPSTGTPLFSTTLTSLSANTIRTLVLANPGAGAAAGTAGTVITLSDQN
ncbi:hypothetical protein tb265_33280 [Gemmatimonadetes bacterium T265]|nr:hypothetical protein tb265_33280 [Gemmatimonadetes bacterium T265]